MTPVVYFIALLAAIVAGIVVADRLVAKRIAARPPAQGSFDYRDPYLIAALRGGPSAVIELAIVALVDRGLLRVLEATFDENANVIAPRHDAVDFGANDLERALLGAAKVRTSVRYIVIVPDVVAAADAYIDRLGRLGLLVDREERSRLRGLYYVCLLPAAVVVALRLVTAPEIFQAVLSIAVLVVTYAIVQRRVRGANAQGLSLLQELSDLFEGLQKRAGDLRGGRMSSDAMFCGATFGLWSLPATEYPAAAYYSAEARRRKSDDGGSGSSSSSSGCGASDSSDSSGSSDGGGGGDGGGGCGGGCGGG